MKLLKKYIDKNKEGSVELVCEDAEDIWHVFNIIRKGDKVKTRTFRKIANVSSKSNQRVSVILVIVVEGVNYDPTIGQLRIKGRICEQNAYARIGAYHTLDVVVNSRFKLFKEEWDSYDLQRIHEALDVGRNTDVAAVMLHEGLAHICLLTPTMTIIKSKIDMPVARKRKFSSQHDKSFARFVDAVVEAFIRHVNLSVVKCVVVASPGFVKDHFMTALFERAEKNSKIITPADKSKFVVTGSSSGFKHSLKAILSEPALAIRLADTKAQEEVRTLTRFLELLDSDPYRALYGYKHVCMAHERLAIDTLMVSDSRFRSHDIAQRREYIALVESVKDAGGKVLIFSSLHVSGEQLNQLTGVAAILRFPLLEIDDEEEDEESSDDEEDKANDIRLIDKAMEEITIDGEDGGDDGEYDSSVAGTGTGSAGHWAVDDDDDEEPFM